MQNIVPSANTEYKFRFSIIMAVYNVEQFIEDAIDSVISQTIGFEHVQIILVDDGSPDSSGKICDDFHARYPNNIVVVHKENGGVSTARNEGLKYIEGKYVNCMDPDDILEPQTLETVYNFFEENYSAMDVACIPIKYFGNMSGGHYLNDKFAAGTRVINLAKEVKYFQLSCSTAFIKNSAAKKIKFNTSLTVAEDAEQVIKLLIDMPYLGVVHNCFYMYRRHSSSALAAGLKKCWYNDYIYGFVLPTIEYAREKYGYLPRFVQNALMSNLQWRLTEKDVPKVLSDEEFAEYKAGVLKCIKFIDDDIINAQKHVSSDVKIALTSIKYPKEQYVSVTNNDIILGFDSAVNARISTSTFSLDFLKMDDEKITISAHKTIINVGVNISDVYLKFNDETIRAENMSTHDHSLFVGDAVSLDYRFDFVIPKNILKEENVIKFYVVSENLEIENKSIVFGPHFPIEKRYKNSYYFENGIVFAFSANTLIISKANSRWKYERRFLGELWRSNQLGERKAVVARLLSFAYKKLNKKPIWIISDRLNKSGDNGEAFFRYLRNSKFKDAKCFYTISKCPSYFKMKKVGPVINYDSLRYKIVHLAADATISSHADLQVYNPFAGYSQPYKDILASKKKVFLQHGIMESDLSGWLNKYEKNLTAFICSAKGERDSIVNGKYLYSEDVVWLTGLPRFDRLYNDECNYITLMPTWRRYLMSKMDSKTGVWEEKDGFEKSEYFEFYNSLINDPRLLSAARKHGYKICFMPHPNIITKIGYFKKNEDVHFFSINDEYRDVYAKSNLVMTDYSSSVFDFAYLHKPVLYTQFDKADFYGGDHVGASGYFDFERDGFGEVAYDYESTVSLLIEYIESGCKLKDKYRERIDSFFAYNDKNNSERILEKILEIK